MKNTENTFDFPETDLVYFELPARDLATIEQWQAANLDNFLEAQMEILIWAAWFETVATDAEWRRFVDVNQDWLRKPALAGGFLLG